MVLIIIDDYQGTLSFYGTPSNSHVVCRGTFCRVHSYIRLAERQGLPYTKSMDKAAAIPPAKTLLHKEVRIVGLTYLDVSIANPAQPRRCLPMPIG